MAGETGNVQSGAEPMQTMDVTQCVHARMIFGELRESILAEDQVADETRTAILRRLFPSITGEALLWFQAHRSRGVMVFDFDRIRLVPEQELREDLGESWIDSHGLHTALARYNPLRQALILMRFESWCELLIADQGEHPTSLGLYSASA